VICVRAPSGPGEAREVAAGTDGSSRTMKFGVGDGFYVELRRRVETFLGRLDAGSATAGRSM
jgi:hypothetical protein